MMAGRFDDFEGGAPELRLPSRPARRRGAPSTPPAITGGTDLPPQQEEPPTGTPSGAGPAVEDMVPTPAAVGRGMAEKTRPSNVQIPVKLLPMIDQIRSRGLSHGELIMAAIEAAYPHLDDLIHPAAAGGSIFAPRPSRVSRSADGPLTPFNYSMRRSDYEAMDNLVTRFNATSRGHLVTVALKFYLDAELSQDLS